MLRAAGFADVRAELDASRWPAGGLAAAAIATAVAVSVAIGRGLRLTAANAPLTPANAARDPI